MTFPQCKKLALRHYRHLDNGNSRQICSYVFGCLPTGACSGFSWCFFFVCLSVFFRDEGKLIEFFLRTTFSDLADEIYCVLEIIQSIGV